MDFSVKAALPLFGGCSSSSVTRKDSASVKVKVACEKRFRRTRKLSRKRRRVQRKSYKKNRELRSMAPESVEEFDSYWQNYHRCLKWTQNHYVSFWKSRVQALEYENRMLRSLLDQNNATQSSFTSSLHSSYCKRNADESGTSGAPEVNSEHMNTKFDLETTRNEMNCEIENEGVEEECDENGEEFEFEVDSNMIEFFTQSMKHKLALHQERSEGRSAEGGRRRDSNDSVNWRKIRNMPREQHYSREEKSNSEMFGANKRKMYLSQCQLEQKIEATELQDILLRKAELEEKEKQKVDIYGKSAPKIMGMETAMQLNFRQVCLSKRPTPWPVIPLNL